MDAVPLLAVDGHHLLYRSWWGFASRRIMSRDKTRDLTGVFGFLAILRKTHLEAAPGHETVVAFDAEDAAATRQASDPGYKAARAAGTVSGTRRRCASQPAPGTRSTFRRAAAQAWRATVGIGAAVP
jgi:5'-3' exonuclease